MTGIVNAFWDKLQETVSFYQEDDRDIVFNQDKYDEFKKCFENSYDFIKDKYMKSSVRALDRHKVAAVMIVASLKSNVVSYRKTLGEKKHFFGEEMFSTEVALNWMLDALNKKLRELGVSEVQEYHMPKAFACETPYFDIFCRNLYYAEQYYVLNPLDISEKLYLLVTLPIGQVFQRFYLTQYTLLRT